MVGKKANETKQAHNRLDRLMKDVIYFAPKDADLTLDVENQPTSPAELLLWKQKLLTYSNVCYYNAIESFEKYGFDPKGTELNKKITRNQFSGFCVKLRKNSV